MLRFVFIARTEAALDPGPMLALIPLGRIERRDSVRTGVRDTSELDRKRPSAIIVVGWACEKRVMCDMGEEGAVTSPAEPMEKKAVLGVAVGVWPNESE